MMWLKLVWSAAKKFPVMFAHFPGPMVLALVVAMAAAASMASCVTNKLNAGALAEARLETANVRAEHAGIVTKAAEEKLAIVQDAAARQAKYDAEYRAAMLAMAQVLGDTAGDDRALSALAKSIEDLHRDPNFACRLLPLPESHLDWLRLPAETPRPAGAGP